MNIILSDMAQLGVYLIPIVPSGTTITANGKNETLETLNGNYNHIKTSDLKQISWSSVFPVNKKYNFVPFGALSNGWLYVSFLELMKKYKLPIRVIVTTKQKIPVLNMLAGIKDFSYNVDKVGDINYSISLTEFPNKFWKFLNYMTN